jgi:hypothetical protein
MVPAELPPTPLPEVRASLNDIGGAAVTGDPASAYPFCSARYVAPPFNFVNSPARIPSISASCLVTMSALPPAAAFRARADAACESYRVFASFVHPW